MKATLLDSDPLFMANKASDTQGEAYSENQVLAGRESRSSLFPCSASSSPITPPPPCVSMWSQGKHTQACWILLSGLITLRCLILLFVCVCACMVDDHGGQKRALDTVELTMQVVVSQTMWMLGTALRSSTRAVCAFSEPSLQPHSSRFFLRLIESPHS